MTPNQRSMRARLAAYAMWGNQNDRTAVTAPARKAFLDRFEKLADPEGVLAPQERAKKAEALRKAHYTRMALRSAQVRAARKSGHAA